MSRSAHRDLRSDSLPGLLPLEAPSTLEGPAHASEHSGPRPAEVAAPETGRLVAHYKLLERLDDSSTGAVYRARDTKLGRTVAVKLLAPALVADPEYRRVVLDRARRVMDLSHPSIATLFDVGEAETETDSGTSTVYLAFEHVEGRVLGTSAGGRALGIRQAVDFGVQLADALAEAHGHGLAHGDVRAETIFVTQKDRAKLLEFGLSQVLAGRPVVLGPPDGEGDRSDIRDLGRVLFAMLTGHAPSTPLRLDTAPGGRMLPQDLVPVLRRALATDDSRYLSAATLAAELRSVAAILDVRMAAGEAELVRESASRTRWAMAVLVAFLLSGLLVSAYLWRSELAAVWRGLFGSSTSLSLSKPPLL